MKKNKGFIAITSIIIISAILLSVSIGISYRSMARAQSNFSSSSYHEANYLSERCAEYALLELERTLGYSGEEEISTVEGSCNILEVLGNGNTNRIIMTTGTVLEHMAKTRIVISEIYPIMTISSWDTVADF